MTGEDKTSSPNCAVIKLSESTDQERAETDYCGINLNISHENDSDLGICQILEEDEDPCLLHREKRLKMSNAEHSDRLVIQVETGFSVTNNRNSSFFEQKRYFTSRINRSFEEDGDPCLLHRDKRLRISNPEKSDLPVIQVEAGLTPADSRNRSLSESELSGCFENISKTRKTPKDGKCVEIAENWLLHESPDRNSGSQNNVNEETIVKSNKNDVLNMLTPVMLEHRTEELPSATEDTLLYHKKWNGSADVTVNGNSSSCSRKKLLVLDVNGLLVALMPYIPYDYDPDELINRKAVFKRPHVHDFLDFCFEKFTVGIWSSRTRRNVEPLLDYLLGDDKHKLAFTWDQSHCTDSGFFSVEKRGKPILLKKLKKLWDKCEPGLPWEKGDYDETNTVLVDDTPHKALSNPPYNAIFPPSYKFTDAADNSLGPGGDIRSYLEGLAAAENVQEYIKQHPFGQRPISEKNLSWAYYRKVLEAVSTPPRQEESGSLPGGAQGH